MRGKRGFGNLGEDYAVELIVSKGYKVILRNFRSKVGEIDIVASDNDTLVFIEVKSRWSSRFGKPEEAVNSFKLRHIERAGEFFLLAHKDLAKKFKKLRIDVVALEVDGNKVKRAKIIKVV